MRTALLLLLLVMGILPCDLHGQLPEAFYDQKIGADFDFPTGLTFDGNGRMYVWEKKGKVWIVDTTGQRLPEPFIDISEEVADWKDHGLLGFALDPGFLNNGRFYLLYALDLHHYWHYGTPEYHPDTTVTFQPSIGRVARYEADPATGYTTTRYDSRKVLLGETLGDGIPLLYEFHGLGSLVIGEDGTLLVSCGDATSAGEPNTGGDLNGTMISRAIDLGIITEDQDVGSYRAQYLGSLNGKILRLDPETGAGLPSNPFFEPERPRSPQSRIWAWGLRNPYRFIMRPNTGSHYPEDGQPGTLYVGDVGNSGWEEIDVITEGGQNFGWPIFEGVNLHWGFWIIDAPYNQMAPNPLYEQGNCDQPYFTFRDLITWPLQDDPERSFPNPCNSDIEIPEEYHPSIQVMPPISWSNARWNPPKRAVVPVPNTDNAHYINGELGTDATDIEGDAFDGFSALSGVFYDHDHFPEAYRGKYFGVDFSGWIQVFDFDEENRLLSVEPFHDDVKDIIHLALNPHDGKLYYLNLTGELRQISYGGNPPPVPVIEADRFYGAGPLTVQFDGRASYDSNLPITGYSWDFGDGTTSTEPDPQHTFTAPDNRPHSFTVALTVTDSLGATATTEKIVSLNNTPPVAHISSFEDGDLYPLDRTTLLVLNAEVTDAEYDLADLTYEWRVYFHHNDHFHPEAPVYDQSTYALISPLGCGDEIYWYRVELKVTDPAGLTATDSRSVHPNCGDPFVEFANLSGTASGDHVELEWTTAMAHDIAVMEVQRTSDFYHYETIGTVEPRGDGTHTYRFSDPSPQLGANIYRIKVISTERAYTHSNLTTVPFPSESTVWVWPNPADRYVNLQGAKAHAGQIRFELYDTQGRQLLRTAWPAVENELFEYQIPTDKLPGGVYYYRLINGSLSSTGQIVISR